MRECSEKLFLLNVPLRDAPLERFKGRRPKRKEEGVVWQGLQGWQEIPLETGSEGLGSQNLVKASSEHLPIPERGMRNDRGGMEFIVRS